MANRIVLRILAWSPGLGLGPGLNYFKLARLPLSA